MYVLSKATQGDVSRCVEKHIASPTEGVGRLTAPLIPDIVRFTASQLAGAAIATLLAQIQNALWRPRMQESTHAYPAATPDT